MHTSAKIAAAAVSLATFLMAPAQAALADSGASPAPGTRPSRHRPVDL